jgi:hypothetical protein
MHQQLAFAGWGRAAPTQFSASDQRTTASRIITVAFVHASFAPRTPSTGPCGKCLRRTEALRLDKQSDRQKSRRGHSNPHGLPPCLEFAPIERSLRLSKLSLLLSSCWRCFVFLDLFARTNSCRRAATGSGFFYAADLGGGQIGFFQAHKIIVRLRFVCSRSAS